MSSPSDTALSVDILRHVRSKAPFSWGHKPWLYLYKQTNQNIDEICLEINILSYFSSCSYQSAFFFILNIFLYQQMNLIFLNRSSWSCGVVRLGSQSEALDCKPKRFDFCCAFIILSGKRWRFSTPRTQRKHSVFKGSNATRRRDVVLRAENVSSPLNWTQPTVTELVTWYARPILIHTACCCNRRTDVLQQLQFGFHEVRV